MICMHSVAKCRFVVSTIFNFYIYYYLYLYILVFAIGLNLLELAFCSQNLENYYSMAIVPV